MLRQANIAIFMLLVSWPAGAEAQVATKWDLAGFAGLFSNHAPDDTSDFYQDTWFETAGGGVVVGRYLTPRLKLEVEALTTTEGRRFTQRAVTIPGVPGTFPLSAEVRSSTTSAATMVVWQFFENEWVHPFVSAGISADFERRSVFTWPQQFSPPDPVRGARGDIAGGLDGPHRTATVRPSLGGGVKLYVSERAFFRADGRASIGRDRQQIGLRLGFGLDF